MHHYFAFGSNMNPEQMESRVGKVSAPIPAVLIGYKLVFNKWSYNRLSWAANVIKTDNPDDIVEGVIYNLTDFQISMLDHNEGYNPKGPYNPNGYRRKNATVIINDQKQIVEIYITDNHKVTDDNKPDYDYIKNFLKAKPYYSDKWYNTLLDWPLRNGLTARRILEMPPSNDSSITMQILSGFIAAIGVAAIAVAFSALNAASMNIPGLLVTSIGTAAAIVGVIGLFKNSPHSDNNLNQNILFGSTHSLG